MEAQNKTHGTTHASNVSRKRAAIVSLVLHSCIFVFFITTNFAPKKFKELREFLTTNIVTPEQQDDPGEIILSLVDAPTSLSSTSDAANIDKLQQQESLEVAEETIEQKEQHKKIEQGVEEDPTTFTEAGDFPVADIPVIMHEIPKVASPEQPSDDAKEFFSLAQKLLQNIKSEESGPGDYEGGTQGISAVADAKSFSYRKKVTEHLMSACKIMRSRYLDNIRNAALPAQEASLDIVIKDDGSIKHAKILASSGSTAFDEFVLKTIRYAEPFPSIPKHLGISEFKLSGMYNMPT
ncbi:TonB family protein [bacterium]|nr:TonB family protein [bacterium]